ncbi:hypothetical protein AK812_SmicGene44593 [Symbiodinium microadriaticum]|uniref:Uncharacterized protein n=1 Tax=Symbiodinium microadriaticum TaxID=2951 RepID=A0A1Q9BY19_SYMMI|nr:hypothetical protein AK812_SmicGene44593 [Symbiodinium microadriaticum]
MEVDKDTGGVRHSKAEQYLPKIPMLNYEKMVSRSSEINYWSSGLHELQHHRYEGVHEDARGFCDVQQDPGESRFDLRVSRRSVPERLSGHHHGRPAAARGAMQFLTNAVKAFAMERGMLSMVPDELTLSLRATLLQRFTTVWLQRLEACVATEEAKAQAVEMMILREDGTVPYLQYNKTTMKLMIKEDREPMDFDEVRRIIKELGDLALLPLTILRFHPLRKLVEECQGDILPMTLQLGLRTPEADRCWQHCSRLAHSGACRAVAMTMRGEKLGRTGLAVHIQEMMNKRSEPYA